MDISIDPTSTAQVNSTLPQTGNPGGALGKEQFLELLMAQLSHQDPLDPVDNSESIAQMAQFSSLEQMQNVSGQLAEMRQSSGLMNGLALHGKNVELLTESGEKHEGTIDRVAWESDGISVSLNGESISLSNVIEVRQSESAQQAPENN